VFTLWHMYVVHVRRTGYVRRTCTMYMYAVHVSAWPQTELALGGWLVTYRNECPAPRIEPGHGCPSQYQPGPT